MKDYLGYWDGGCLWRRCLNWRRELFNNLAGRYELMGSVKKGEVTLAGTVEEYVCKFWELAKKRKADPLEVDEFERKAIVLDGIVKSSVNERNTCRIDAEGNDYSKGLEFLCSISKIEEMKREHKGNLRKIFSEGMDGAMWTLIWSNLVPVIGIWYAGIKSIELIGSYSKVKLKYKEKNKEVENLFEGLHITCGIIDEAVHQVYIGDYYKDHPLLFMNTFERMEEKWKKHALALAFKQEPNAELDEWLSEKYEDLVIEVGRDNYLE